MSNYRQKRKENKNNSSYSRVPASLPGTSTFIDSRKESTVQKKLSGIAKSEISGQRFIQLQKIADKSVTNEVIQLYRQGYQPLLARQPRAVNSTAYSKATFARPSNFDNATIQEVYRRAEQMRIKFPPPNGPLTVFYKCRSCKKWFQYEAMQIGHIQKWADYVENTQPANTAEATDAYNDLNNLELECSTCNAGHAFEEMEKMKKEDYDDHDSFIDDSEFDSKENDKAFKELRENVLPGIRGQQTK